MRRAMRHYGAQYFWALNGLDSNLRRSAKVVPGMFIEVQIIFYT